MGAPLKAGQIQRLLAPQPGPQMRAAMCSADLLVYGGQAGGGKSYLSVLESCRNVSVPGYTAGFFRRRKKDIRAPKGLWETGGPIWGAIGGDCRNDLLEARFGSGAFIKMAQLNHANDREDHRGAEYCDLFFDEGDQITSRNFWYMFSRNRSTCGLRPRTVFTCNPNPKSHIRKFIDWWIGPKGYPRKERSGHLRYFARDGNRIVWGATRDEVVKQAPHIEALARKGEKVENLVMSATFIPATLDDNPILLEKDPSYRAKLHALSYVDRMRLQFGNWNITEAAGTMFRRSWAAPVTDIPHGRRVRYWDLAGERKTKKDEDRGAFRQSDFVVGVRMVGADGKCYVDDVVRTRCSVRESETLIRDTSRKDGADTEVWIEQEIGSAGEYLYQHIRDDVVDSGARVVPDKVRGRGDKITAAKPASSAMEGGRLRFLKDAPWFDALMDELEMFPDGDHDDQVDAMVGAYRALTSSAFFFESV